LNILSSLVVGEGTGHKFGLFYVVDTGPLASSEFGVSVILVLVNWIIVAGAWHVFNVFSF
jgi:hypothetical protein